MYFDRNQCSLKGSHESQGSSISLTASPMNLFMMLFEHVNTLNIFPYQGLQPCVWFVYVCVCVSACRCTGCVKDEPWRRAVHFALSLFLSCSFPRCRLRNDLGDRDHSLFVVSISHNWALVPEGQVYRIRTGLHNTEKQRHAFDVKQGVCVCVSQVEGGDWFQTSEI